MRNENLAELIRAEYGSLAHFARKINWSRQRLYWQLQNPEKLTIGMAQKMLHLLESRGRKLSLDIFLPEESNKT